MASTVFTPDRPALVRRLRAAGCVFAEDEADLLIAAADSAQSLTRLVDRRVAGLPLEHLLGWAEFCGRRIAVHPGVFVPRGRTALLVDAAAALAGPAPAVLDLCCGSGAAAVVLHERLAPRWLAAADIDPVAVAVRAAQPRPARRPGLPGRPVRRAAGRLARPAGPGGGERAVRADRRGGLAAGRGAVVRGPGGAGRRRGRPGRAAPGRVRRGRVARPGRACRGRGERRAGRRRCAPCSPPPGCTRRWSATRSARRQR